MLVLVPGIQQEEIMDRPQCVLPRRQQAFEFAKSEMWEHLPADSRRDCQVCLAQLLLQVFSQERSHDDERKD
jgi:hypothetical protein